MAACLPASGLLLSRCTLTCAVCRACAPPLPKLGHRAVLQLLRVLAIPLSGAALDEVSVSADGSPSELLVGSARLTMLWLSVFLILLFIPFSLTMAATYFNPR